MGFWEGLFSRLGKDMNNWWGRLYGNQKLLTARERGVGRGGELSEEKKNNLLNEKEFDRSAFSKTDKLNLSWKLTVATSGFAGITWN